MSCNETGQDPCCQEEPCFDNNLVGCHFVDTKFQSLWEAIRQYERAFSATRELALAKTNLQQARMWFRSHWDECSRSAVGDQHCAAAE